MVPIFFYFFLSEEKPFQNLHQDPTLSKHPQLFSPLIKIIPPTSRLEQTLDHRLYSYTSSDQSMAKNLPLGKANINRRNLLTTRTPPASVYRSKRLSRKTSGIPHKRGILSSLERRKSTSKGNHVSAREVSEDTINFRDRSY